MNRMSIWEPSRHLLAIASGVFSGFIPTGKSFLNPILLGAILALVYVKLMLGGIDNDFLFVCVFASEGALGAWIAQKSIS